MRFSIIFQTKPQHEQLRLNSSQPSSPTTNVPARDSHPLPLPASVTATNPSSPIELYTGYRQGQDCNHARNSSNGSVKAQPPQLPPLQFPPPTPSGAPPSLPGDQHYQDHDQDRVQQQHRSHSQQQLHQSLPSQSTVQPCQQHQMNFVDMHYHTPPSHSIAATGAVTAPTTPMLSPTSSTFALVPLPATSQQLQQQQRQRQMSNVPSTPLTPLTPQATTPFGPLSPRTTAALAPPSYESATGLPPSADAVKCGWQPQDTKSAPPTTLAPSAAGAVSGPVTPITPWPGAQHSGGFASPQASVAPTSSTLSATGTAATAAASSSLTAQISMAFARGLDAGEASGSGHGLGLAGGRVRPTGPGRSAPQLLTAQQIQRQQQRQEQQQQCQNQIQTVPLAEAIRMFENVVTREETALRHQAHAEFFAEQKDWGRRQVLREDILEAQRRLLGLKEGISRYRTRLERLKTDLPRLK